MATQLYHRKVLNAIDALARYYARQEAKRQIRARGQRVTDYDPKDISIMARALLLAQPEHFVERAKASAVVKDWRRRLPPKRRARLNDNQNIRAMQKSACSRHFHLS